MNPEITQEDVYRGQFIADLRHAIGHSSGLDLIAKGVAEMIRNEYWKRYYSNTTGMLYTNDDFHQWVTAAPPEGLNTNIQKLKELCKAYPDVIQVIEGNIQEIREPGRPWAENNVDISTLNDDVKGGTSRNYIIARLKRDAPELAEQVIAQEISAAEGKRQAQAAGQWVTQGRATKRSVTLKDVDKVDDVAKLLLHYLEHDQIHELLIYLAEAIK